MLSTFRSANFFLFSWFLDFGCLFQVDRFGLCSGFRVRPSGICVAVEFSHSGHFGRFWAVYITSTNEWSNSVTDFDCRPSWLRLWHLLRWQQPLWQQPLWQQPLWQQPLWQQPLWQQPLWQSHADNNCDNTLTTTPTATPQTVCYDHV